MVDAEFQIRNFADVGVRGENVVYMVGPEKMGVASRQSIISRLILTKYWS